VSAPWQPAQEARGLLLVSGGTGPVSTWLRRGLVACQVIPLGPWTAVVPTESSSRAEAPYDNAVMVLAARPVPRRLRSALGFFTVDGRAVVTVQRPGWRSEVRWLVWEPGAGLVRAPGLELARPADLVGPGIGLRGQVVAPTAQAVARFDARMAEQARHPSELEENS
jgi:hypothetical protein